MKPSFEDRYVLNPYDDSKEVKEICLDGHFAESLNKLRGKKHYGIEVVCPAACSEELIVKETDLLFQVVSECQIQKVIFSNIIFKDLDLEKDVNAKLWKEVESRHSDDDFEDELSEETVERISAVWDYLEYPNIGFKYLSYCNCKNIKHLLKYLLTVPEEHETYMLREVKHVFSNNEYYEKSSDLVVVLLKDNYKITKCENVNIMSERTINRLKMDQYFIDFERLYKTNEEIIAGYVERNIEGYKRCTKACLTLLLIKKFRSSPFNIIGNDVTKIIVKMVHQSRGTSIWSSYKI